MRLFELDERIEKILAEGTDRDTGVISEECLVALEELELEKGAKCLATAAVIKGMKAEGEAVEREAKKLSARAQIHFNQADRLTQYLASNYHDGEPPLSDARSSITWRKNPPKVIIQDEAQLARRYLTIIPRSTKPDKKAIAATLKNGKKVKGAILQHSQRLEIK